MKHRGIDLPMSIRIGTIDRIDKRGHTDVLPALLHAMYGIAAASNTARPGDSVSRKDGTRHCHPLISSA